MSSAKYYAPAHAVDSTDEDEQSDTWSFEFEDAPYDIVPESQVSEGPKVSAQQPRLSLPIDEGSSDDFPARLSDRVAHLKDKIRALRTSQKTFIESLNQLCDSLGEDYFAPETRRSLLPFVVGIKIQRLLGPHKRAMGKEGTKDRAAIQFLDAWGSLDNSVLNELQTDVESAVSKQTTEKRSECDDSRRRISEAFVPRGSVVHGGLGTTTEDYYPETAAHGGDAPLGGVSRRLKGQRSADKRPAKEGTRKLPHRTSATHSSEGRRRAAGKHDSAYDDTQLSESEGSDRYVEIAQSSIERESKLRANYGPDEYLAEQTDTANVRRHASSHWDRGQDLSPSGHEYLPPRRGYRRGTNHREAYIEVPDWPWRSGGRS